MAREFEGKAVIVTGSSSGIGEAVAILFAKRGAMVTLCGRDEDRLKEAVKKCQQAGGGNKDRYISVCGDVNDKEVRERIVDKTIEKFGRLDVLVCNHGIILPAIILDEETENEFDTVINTNLKSVYFLIQKSVPHLEKTEGNVVCVSSGASTLSSCGPITYSFGKAALDHMTRVLALHLGPRGIRINAINPTVVESRLYRNMPFPQGFLEYYVNKVHPLKGRDYPCPPEEQAYMVVFLASAEAGFVTGQCVAVDGGILRVGPSLTIDGKMSHL